jgi:hypothetical protein
METKYKDREAMDLNTVGETQQAGQKISKKKLVTLLRLSYDLLDKNQVASIVALIERMVVAKQNGENLTVAFRDWNEDGTRRF